MFSRLFQQFKLKKLAKQLRKPDGAMGAQVGERMNKANEFLYDRTIDTMNFTGNEQVLEIGFGNGKFFDKLFGTASGLSISGLDYSADMVSAAIKNNKAAVGDGRLKLYVGNSDKMPFADNSFSLIFCINVIYFWDNPVQHLLEIKRVLKPGGKFFATIRTKESMLQMPFTKYGFCFYDTESWNKELTQAGLLLASVVPIREPVVNVDGKEHSIQSNCMIAAKPPQDV